MEIIHSFKEQQEKSVEVLQKLADFLSEGKDLGVEIDPKLQEKIQNVIAETQDQKLRVALIGGFSEGKTSIAAAWLERFDKSNMRIDHRESSDSVVVYSIDDKIELVDTPGLFGFKEKMNATTQEEEKYKDITRKYISESHLVLYVMNATNPIKESHQAELQWLFNDLNLLPRTIFVFSKFDNVADVEDEEDFNAIFAIKKGNVIERLRESIGLQASQEENLSIVAVCANPFDEGIEYWLQHLEEFKKLSHIALLQNATLEKIKTLGGNERIIQETKQSVIADVLDRIIPQAKAEKEEVVQQLKECSEIHDNLQRDLDKIEQKIPEAQKHLRMSIVEYFTDLISQARGTSLETFADFAVREIGKEGINIQIKIRDLFQNELSVIQGDIYKIQTRLERNTEDFQGILQSYGKSGLNYLQQSGLINANNIKLVRDGIVSVGKIVGLDLSTLLKFKPWGATKLANGANAALGFLSLALEFWDSYKQYQDEQDFEKGKTQLISDFENQKKELLEYIDSGDFVLNFGNYKELQGEMLQFQEAITQAEHQQKQFLTWVKKGENIDKDFIQSKA